MEEGHPHPFSHNINGLLLRIKMFLKLRLKKKEFWRALYVTVMWYDHVKVMIGWGPLAMWGSWLGIQLKFWPISMKAMTGHDPLAFWPIKIWGSWEGLTHCYSDQSLYDYCKGHDRVWLIGILTNHSVRFMRGCNPLAFWPITLLGHSESIEQGDNLWQEICSEISGFSMQPLSMWY